MWNLFKHYRPERHYMRGPGAKWYDKNALPTSSLSEQKLVGIRRRRPCNLAKSPCISPNCRERQVGFGLPAQPP